MINSREDWVLILPSKRKKSNRNGLDDYVLHWGKFVVLGDQSDIEELAQEVNWFVESGRVPRAKYGPIPDGKYALLLYCDDRDKDDVEEVLAELGVEKYFWKYERETLREKLIK